MTAPPGPRTTRGSWPVPEWNVSGSPSSSATAQNAVVLAVVVRAERTARREEQRAEPLSARRSRLGDRVVDVEHRHRADREQRGMPANTSAAQSLYARHSCELELGVVGREARLQRERREDHLGADAVAQLVAEAVVGVEVADDRDLALGRRHELPRVETLDEQRAPAVTVSMRGTRSRYSASTRSAYSSIGSVTCESVEM